MAGRRETTGRVRAQYESYPYPPRDPEEEERHLRIGSPSHLWELNHYLFAGARDFSRPFRALVAGGGTGDGLIMLAQQLADAGCPAEIVYLDLSEASRQVAEARAEVRGLQSIRFFNGDLRDAASHGPFDYIDCCGVLHHLDEPGAGFRALKESLAPDGGMGVMVYGTLGRTGVYSVQDMLRQIAGGGPDEDRVAMAKRLLANLPPTNWLRRNPFVEDHKTLSDPGIYDLLLHARDRSYRVAELQAEVRDAGLRIAALIEPARYDPLTYLQDPDLRAAVGALDWIDRCAFAEALAGNMTKHVAYLVHAENRAETVARPVSRDMVPVTRDVPGTQIAAAIKPDGVITVDAGGMKIDAPLPPLAGGMLSRIDGRRSLAAIHGELSDRVGWKEFKTQFDAIYAVLNGFNQMYLRVGEGPAGGVGPT